MARMSVKDIESPGSLNIYLKDLRGNELLTAAEEQVLAIAIAKGDRDAKARLVQSNLRLVVSIARGYLGRGLTLEDLIGEGNLGLIKAADKFDPSYKTRFSTYATYWIKEAIVHALICTTPPIRLPENLVRLLTKWRKATNSFIKEFGYPPTSDQVAVVLGLTDSQKTRVEDARRAHALRNGGEEGHRDPMTVEQSADHRVSSVTAIEQGDEWKAVLHRLDALSERERAVITLRFGLQGESPHSIEQVSRRIGSTESVTRKMEAQAIQKLGRKQVPLSPMKKNKSVEPTDES